MSLLVALALGIVQGVSEFLPISSSGHIALGQMLFGLTDISRYLFFNIVCHLGTLLAILLVYRKELLALPNNPTLCKKLLIGTLPLFPLVVAVKAIKGIYDSPVLIGFCFLITAFLLFAATWWRREVSEERLEQRGFRDAFLIGLFQALALLPGVSRSGSTISGALLLGWPRERAVTFSLLLAIIAILGAASLEGLKLLVEGDQAVGLTPWHYLVAFLSSAVVGFFSLKLLIRVVLSDRLTPFAWYCTALGLFCITYFGAGAV